jgi:hypothetical protein
MRTQNPPPLKACRFDSDLGHQLVSPIKINSLRPISPTPTGVEPPQSSRYVCSKPLISFMARSMRTSSDGTVV